MPSHNAPLAVLAFSTHAIWERDQPTNFVYPEADNRREPACDLNSTTSLQPTCCARRWRTRCGSFNAPLAVLAFSALTYSCRHLCTQVEDKIRFIRGDFFEEVQGIKVRLGCLLLLALRIKVRSECLLLPLPPFS